MTDEEIHNIYLHMSGKAEGLVEATGNADFPVLFARAILEYGGLTKDAQNMASKSTYKEQLEAKDEPVAWEQFHEHMAGPNYVAPKRTWIGRNWDLQCLIDLWGTRMTKEEKLTKDYALAVALEALTLARTLSSGKASDQFHNAIEIIKRTFIEQEGDKND